jgi:hypothetical protein
MLIEAGAEAVDEGDCADVQCCVVCIGRTRAIRCHYGHDAVDVKLSKPIASCRLSGDNHHPQIACN